MSKNKKCLAFVESTGTRCTKGAIRGSKYCWWHQPKGFMILSLLLGAVISLVIAEVWQRLVPSNELTEIKQLRSEYNDSIREPSFQVYLNNRLLADKCIYNIPATTEIQNLIFTLRNRGNQVAHDLTFSIKFPNRISQLQPAGLWQEQKASIISNSEVILLPDKSYIISANPLGPQNTVEFAPIKIKGNLDSTENFYIHIKVTASDADPFYLPFILNIVPGLKSECVNNNIQ